MANDDDGQTEQDDARSRVFEDNRLKPEYVSSIIDALDEGAVEEVCALVEPLHPADVADLIELVDQNHRPQLVAALGERLDADVIAELNDWVRDELFSELSPTDVAGVVAQLDTDDAVAVLADLDDADQREILDAMPADDRAAIEAALTYPEDSAGRLMQRDLVSVPEYWTVGHVIDFLRENPDLATDFFEIFVVDPAYKPVGTIRLSWILRAPRVVNVADIMQRDQTLIPVDMDQEEVAYQFQQYGLVSAAVVDGSGRLAGMITVDDVVHVVQAEASEDFLKSSGAGEGDINEPVRAIVNTRLRWLVVNCGTAVLASIVIALFQGTIEQMVALAILMPIVASMGGNAGTQTMAVAVRALATNQLTSSNAARIVWKEARVAMLNGAALAVLIGVGAALFFANVPLGLVIATAMVFNILVAGLAGVLVPLTLDRFDIDPAVASSVFVTTTTDVMGFFLFLGLATAVGLAG